MLVLQPQRQQHLLHLAFDRAVWLQEQVLRQLLGQRRAALAEMATHDIRHHRPRQADRIDAEMRVEAPVLDGHDGLRDIGRHFLEAECLATTHAAIGDQVAVDRNDLDVGRPIRDFPGRGRRHLGAVVDDDAGRGDAAPDGENEAPVDEPAENAEKPAATRPTAAAP